MTGFECLGLSFLCIQAFIAVIVDVVLVESIDAVSDVACLAGILLLVSRVIWNLYKCIDI